MAAATRPRRRGEVKRHHPWPLLDLAAEQRLWAALAGRGTTSARSLGEGGLAVALAEAVLRFGVGARIELPAGDRFVALFSESAGRVVVAVPRDVKLTKFARVLEPSKASRR